MGHRIHGRVTNYFNIKIAHQQSRQATVLDFELGGISFSAHVTPHIMGPHNSMKCMLL